MNLHCSAFIGSKHLASGTLQEVAVKAKAALHADPTASLLIFDDATSQVIDFDFRGSTDEAETRSPGRPKLGVIAREVTLLPRHWDWLATQSGGASVALRKLVDHARSANQIKDKQRAAQESAYRFMSAMAGNEPGFEEALRALFANARERFDVHTESWPADIREHARKLAAPAL